MTEITFFQTSDPYFYADMLAQTSRTLRAYCARHGCRYESYVGIKRGDYNWQASFNRLYMFDELVQRGREGWAVYVDADAYICDLGFDLRSWLAEHADKAMIATPSGASTHYWDLNNGVLLFNLSHPTARFILRRWKAAFEGVNDQRVQAATDWHMGVDDQNLFQEVLRDNPHLQGDFHYSHWDLINSPHASFIRQYLRVLEPNLESRTAAIRAQVDSVLAAQA